MRAALSVDISAVKQLHVLWGKIYPYLAKQIIALLPREARTLLELGPFSGGIAFELAKARKAFSVVIADHREEILEFLGREAWTLGLLDRIRLVQTHLTRLVFREAEFDGVIVRGAFFFLNETILKEVHQVLRPGGIGLIGGGFGVSTPNDLIEEIAPESRRLNAQLGKRWISRIELEEMLGEANLDACSRVTEEGGLWVVLEK